MLLGGVCGSLHGWNGYYVEENLALGVELWPVDKTTEKHFFLASR